jgi:ferric-dicitrate binding protein FerR (iron transport regulator)
MRFRHSAALAALSSVALMVSSGGAFAEPVGKASAIRTTALQQEPQAPTAGELHLNDAVIRNATLSTKPSSALEVTFLDGSKLSMGANSTMVVDDYVYSGAGGAGKQTLRATRGVFRFVSGTIPKDQVKIDTPTVTIGIRGTIFRLLMKDDQSGALAVENGPNGESYTVIVKSKKTGQVIELHSGEKVEWDTGGTYGDIGGGTIEGCE